ncbi:hypothetical protein ACH4D5_07545 [Streptomyces sp. NPDC018029]|uniref:hypothetical protein n=1 Tax=Streptomyces sp. NPDC018029 TaxID=3365032 RepID=UPI0037A6B24F
MATSTYPLATLARTTDPTTMLRRFLGLDAVVTAGNGIAYAAASGPLGDFLGVDSGLLLGLGVFLTLFGAGVGYLASRKSPPKAAVQAVVEANAVWALASVVALVGWLSPGTAGAVWIPLQAVTVGGFAVLQYAALRALRP